jgi:hypothetical protein
MHALKRTFLKQDHHLKQLIKTQLPYYAYSTYIVQRCTIARRRGKLEGSGTREEARRERVTRCP